MRYCRAPIDVYIVTNQHFFFFFRQLNKSLIIILDHVGHNRQPMHNAICITRRKCDIIVVIIKWIRQEVRFIKWRGHSTVWTRDLLSLKMGYLRSWFSKPSFPIPWGGGGVNFFFHRSGGFKMSCPQCYHAQKSNCTGSVQIAYTCTSLRCFKFMFYFKIKIKDIIYTLTLIYDIAVNIKCYFYWYS